MPEKNAMKRDFMIAGVLVLGGGAAFFFFSTKAPAGEEIKVYREISGRDGAPAGGAVPAADEPLSAAPEDFAALGDRYFESGMYAEAVEIYRLALKKDPKDADSLNDLGLALLYTGKPDEAVASFKKAVAIDPKLQRAWLSLGFAYRGLKRYDESNAALKKVLELSPASGPAREAAALLKKNEEALALN